MKKTITPLVTLTVLCYSAIAETTAYDGLDVPNDYSDGGDVVGTNGGSGFFGGWLDGGGTTANLDAQTAGLSYLDLETTAGSLINSASGFSKLRRQIADGAQTGTSIYFSYIYDKGTANNADDYLAFGELLGQERFRLRNDGGEIRVDYSHLGVLSPIGTTNGLASSDTIFVVGEYRVGTASDSLTLYFNPTDLTNVAGTATATLSFEEGTDFNFAYGFQYMQINFNQGDTEYDELRFSYGAGASILDVVPTTTPLGGPEAYDGLDVPGDYSAGNDVVGTNGGSGFFGGWLDGGGTDENLDAQASGLNYLDLSTTDGAMINSASGFSKLRRQVANGDITGTTVYFSYIYDKGDINNTLDYLAFGNALGQERFRMINTGGEIEVFYFAGNEDPNTKTLGTTTTLSSTDVIFVVGAYTNGTPSDGLTLYFNPTDLSNVAGTATETLSFAEGTDFNFAYEFEFIQISFNGVNTKYDEFRFAYGAGASILDVVPTSAGVPDPMNVAISVTGNTASISFDTTSGFTYSVRSSSTAGGSYTEFDSVSGDNSRQSSDDTDILLTEDIQFYRVVAQ